MRALMRSVGLSTGVELPYLEAGRPDGLPVLLLHGYGDSCRSFEDVLPHLPPSLRVLAPTQRGHGDAPQPATGYEPRDFARDAAAFLDALDVPAAVIVGHSMGSHVAQRVALDHPAKTLGLVLAGSFVTLRGNAAIAELWEAVSRLSDPVDPAFVRDFQLSTVARPVPTEFFEQRVGDSLRMPARIWRSALAAMLESDTSAELARISAPTLILWGDRDETTPSDQQRALVSGIPRARLVVERGGGHCAHWEDPRWFAAQLAAFVQELSSRAATQVGGGAERTTRLVSAAGSRAPEDGSYSTAPLLPIVANGRPR